MLNMICYDIKKPRNQRRFKQGVVECGEGNHNFSYAPWFVETDHSPTRALRTLAGYLGRKTDSLLVLNLCEGTSSAVLNPRARDAEWLKEHGVDLMGRNQSGVLAIAYTLRGAKSSDYDRVAERIEDEYPYPDFFKPVKALYFVATEESSRQVLRKVKGFLPHPKRGKQSRDELLVLEIPRRTTGRVQLPNGSAAWFQEHGIKRIH